MPKAIKHQGITYHPDSCSLYYHVADGERVHSMFSGEEHKNPHHKLWVKLNKYFTGRGFAVQPDRSVDRLIRKDYKYGKKEKLEFSTNYYPIGFSYEFYQNVNFNNSHGGKHDYDKFALMPRDVKVMFLNEMYRLQQFLAKLGVSVVNPSARTDIQKIIDENNRNTHIHGTITSLEDIGPSLSESDLAYNCNDANGKLIKCGEFKCSYTYDGNLIYGVVYHHINNMWWMIINGKRHNIASFDLFDVYPGVPRRRKLATEKQLAVLHSVMSHFMEKKDFKRCQSILKQIEKIDQKLKIAA